MIKKSLNSLGKKSSIINTMHFLDVCLELQTVTIGLEIKKTPCISVTDNKFLENWRNILKDAELTLMRELTEKDKCIYSELHSEFFIQIEEAIEKTSILQLSGTFNNFLVKSRTNCLTVELRSLLK